MSSATRSMTVWTVYVILLGTVLLVIPNLLLSIFQIEDTDEVWIRIVGLLLLGYGAYYWTAVRAEFTELYHMSVWVRWGIVVGLVVLAFTVGPWQLVLFAMIDLLGGLWTMLTLRTKPEATG
ncbi:MAG: hypothetical protein GWP18_04855 [Proteobacteria bacterium]|nr:hypothetical protein [Pseudomonadota bacterium]